RQAVHRGAARRRGPAAPRRAGADRRRAEGHPQAGRGARGRRVPHRQEPAPAAARGAHPGRPPRARRGTPHQARTPRTGTAPRPLPHVQGAPAALIPAALIPAALIPAAPTRPHTASGADRPRTEPSTATASATTYRARRTVADVSKRVRRTVSATASRDASDPVRNRHAATPVAPFQL